QRVDEPRQILRRLALLVVGHEARLAAGAVFQDHLLEDVPLGDAGLLARRVLADGGDLADAHAYAERVMVGRWHHEVLFAARTTATAHRDVLARQPLHAPVEREHVP